MHRSEVEAAGWRSYFEGEMVDPLCLFLASQVRSLFHRIQICRLSCRITRNDGPNYKFKRGAFGSDQRWNNDRVVKVGNAATYAQQPPDNFID